MSRTPVSEEGTELFKEKKCHPNFKRTVSDFNIKLITADRIKQAQLPLLIRIKLLAAEASDAKIKQAQPSSPDPRKLEPPEGLARSRSEPDNGGSDPFVLLAPNSAKNLKWRCVFRPSHHQEGKSLPTSARPYAHLFSHIYSALKTRQPTPQIRTRSSDELSKNMPFLEIISEELREPSVSEELPGSAESLSP